MADLNLSFATCDYDHVRDIVDGRIKPQGVEITPMVFEEPHLIFHRMTRYNDFDISEMSFGRYISLVSQGANEMTAIPVFPSRVARISSFYVRAGSTVKRPEDLAGKRVGVPEWAQTATIYARGWLAETVGVDLKSIDWIQTGIDEPGRPEPVKIKLPRGIKVTPVTDASLSQMLLSGDIDCAITALPPKPFRDGDRRVKRLVKNSRRAEETYYKETGVFPIMHVLTILNDVLEDHPWVAGNLMDAFEAAKSASLRRAFSSSHAIYPIPWGADSAHAMKDLFGGDVWPYGLEPNRLTIEAFLRFGHAQGVCHRKVAPEELFVPQSMDAAKA